MGQMSFACALIACPGAEQHQASIGISLAGKAKK